MRRKLYTMNEINTILNNCKDIDSLEIAKEIIFSELQEDFTKTELNSVYRSINFKVQTLAMLN